MQKNCLEHLKKYGWCVLKNIIPNSVLDLIKDEAIFTEKRFLLEWSRQNPHINFNTTQSLPLEQLRDAWLAYGKPTMRRYPLRNLITKNFHKFVISKVFTDIAKDIFNEKEIALFGSFNLRAKIKEQAWNITKSHADWQAWEEFSDKKHCSSPNECDVFTFWTPLSIVDESSSCLRVGNYMLSVEENNFLKKKSMTIENSNIFSDIKYLDIKMSPGDLLIFNHKIIHCSNPNLSEKVIWVADWRYQKVEQPYEGKRYGFEIPNNLSNYYVEKSFFDWSKKIINSPSFYKD